jgi:hypothetical protein
MCISLKCPCSCSWFHSSLASSTSLFLQVYEAAQVVRVEQQFGVLLNLPLGGELGGTCPAFCHISNVADEAVSKVEKVMKPGGTAKVRVIGFRLLDGIALVTAKPSIVNQQVGLWSGLWWLCLAFLHWSSCKRGCQQLIEHVQNELSSMPVAEYD